MTTSLPRLGLAQRLSLLAAVAAALFVVGEYLVGLGGGSADFGWFGYAPLTQRSIATVNSGLPNWGQLLIWLGLIGLWTLLALWLLRSQPKQSVDA